MPASPALVPELAPADEAAARLRRHLDAAIGNDDRPIELVGSRAPQWRTEHAGSFAAWGARTVQVRKGHYLAELLQRFVLGERQDRVTEVRDEIGQINPEALTLVATDGSAGMTPRAPFALLDDAANADEFCRAVLSGEATPAWTAEQLAGAGILDAELWRELAGVDKRSARLIDADTSTGVARYVAAWSL